MKELKQKQILKLDRARAVDLEILEKYRGKEVVIERRSYGPLGGIINKVGLEFIYLTNVKDYDTSMSYLRRFPKKLVNFRESPNQILSRSQIEEILLAEDIKKQGEK